MKSFLKFFGALILLICYTCILTGGIKVFAPDLAAETILYKKVLPRTLERSTSIQGMTIVVSDNIEWEKLGVRLKGLWGIQRSFRRPYNSG